jgi:hypothetical protein
MEIWNFAALMEVSVGANAGENPSTVSCKSWALPCLSRKEVSEIAIKGKFGRN